MWKLAKPMSLSFSTAASLTFLCSEAAFLFDFSSVSAQTINSKTTIVQRFGEAQSAATDSFFIDDTGITTRTTNDQELNKCGSAVTRLRPQNGVQGADGERSTSLGVRNTIGNISRDAVSSAPLTCGPSPLSPSDIEISVRASAHRYGVDPGFAAAIAWAESRFDQNRNSPKGARGPMQLMPQTALRLGVADICDPLSNIDGGVRHLAALVDEFKNPMLAAAAYNAGEQAIYDNRGIPPYAETVRYVSEVINRRLGLVVAGKGKTDGRPATPDSFSFPTTETTGGLPAERRPHFVGGVMQFQ
jgi:hypothetical protein